MEKKREKHMCDEHSGVSAKVDEIFQVNCEVRGLWLVMYYDTVIIVGSKVSIKDLVSPI